MTQNFFVALDRSEAMAGDRWNRALETLMVLFADSSLSGTGLALGTFPDTAVPPACDDVSCSPGACSSSLVELARLTSDIPPADMQEHALIRALENLTPDGVVAPLPAALEGATQWAEDHITRHPDELAHVILVASGELNACAETSVASAARAYDERGIRTHVVGFEDRNGPLLDEIAIAGGTEQALVLGNEPEENAAALIGLARLTPGDISCDYPLPAPADNLDFTNVRVTLTTVEGVSARVEQVSGPSACSGHSWHFDSPSNPTALVLCPDSCAGLSSHLYDTLEVSIGCAR
jgi:hypothetical protein